MTKMVLFVGLHSLILKFTVLKGMSEEVYLCLSIQCLSKHLQIVLIMY